VSLYEDPLDEAIGPDSVHVKPWRQRMIYFHRIAGGFMMVKGLLGFAVIVGMIGVPFQTMPMEGKIATVFFSVIDIVSGVALWLGSAWGATLWLIVIAAQISADIVFADASGFMVLLTLVEVMFVAAYVLVRFKVYEEDSR
jgi:hypothetical protein